MAAVDALLGGFGPDFINKARNSIPLDRELRHPPGVDDVISRYQKAHFRVDRQHQGFIDLKEVVLTLGLSVVNFGLWRSQVAEKTDILTIFIQVLILPFPLIAGDDNIKISVIVVIDFQQRGRRGHSHGKQDEKGHHRPGDFYLGALMKGSGGNTARFAMIVDGVKHHPKHQHTDHGRDTEDPHVQVVNFVSHLGDPR